jgi:DNA-binding PadR family transcriptional regulator
MSKVKAFSKKDMPLTPAIFYILMALAIKERHGYDIMKQVEEDSGAKVKLGPGTLYGAIKRMLEDTLIIEIETSFARRKYYKLTDKGRTIFSRELQRYEEALELARRKNLFGYPSLAKLALT